MEVKIFKSLDFCLKVLRIIGLIGKIGFYHIFWIFCHLIFFSSLFFSAICNLYFDLINKEMWIIMEQITLTFKIIRIMIKMWKILSGMKNIMEMRKKTKILVGQMREDHSEEIKINLEDLSMLDKIFICYLITTLIPITLAIFMMSFFKESVILVSYPFDLNNSYWFQLVTVHHTYCEIIGVIVLICYSFLTVTFINKSIMFLEKIQENLTIQDGEDEEIFMRNMETFQLVKELMNDVNSNFSGIFLLESIMMIFDIGFLTFVIFDTNKLVNRFMAIFVLFPVILDTFIPCFYSQMLINSSNHTMKYFASPKWNNMNSSVSEIRTEFLKNNQKPLKFSYKHFITFDMEKFSNFLTACFIPLGGIFIIQDYLS